MRNIRRPVFAIGLGLVSVLWMAGPAAACPAPRAAWCPPNSTGTGGRPLRDCVFVRAVNLATACRPHGRECSPALECRYRTRPGAKEPCGSFIKYVFCGPGKF